MLYDYLSLIVKYDTTYEEVYSQTITSDVPYYYHRDYFCEFYLVTEGLSASSKSENKTTFHFEPGIDFADFKSKISGAKIVGYLTDKDMSPARNDGQFLAAQYILAPVILDLNNPYHNFLILDYNDNDLAFIKIKILGATYLYTNAYGKILAQRKYE